ncbi:MAG: V-type ATP synthase subunit A [Deltaproteobacteria bacterium]|nr:V-type ATP synthase subunit A [Deltaproteobacteria bacterium]
MVIAETEGEVTKNSVGVCHRRDGVSLLCEIIRIRGNRADLQVFEETRGLRIGDRVEFRPEMLSATLGPGLLGQIYDGLQKPLPRLAEKNGYYLTPGSDMPALDTEREWEWTPRVRPGEIVLAGDALGSVPEGIFDHPIMVPFGWTGEFTVEEVTKAGTHTIDDTVAVLGDPEGHERTVSMQQSWPVKRPLCVAGKRMMPSDPLVTRIRIIDSMFPIARGGTYCIPGPFGAGKTVLQQVTSRNAEVDIVIITACGERAGEIVETIREFPKLEDPRTGRSLMERTIIVCNTSAMPVAARDASVYTGITLAEYYRQAGLHVLFLADSTSRWAQAMREISGRLEEIPGEEAFPAYLESRIAGFYERAGMIRLRNGKEASVTIGGTVSPAGGNFDEPVTQATLKVVGAFHGLSRERSDARRYPAIDPTDSWSKYRGIIDPEKTAWVRSLLRRSEEVRQMIAVVGEEGTPMDDFTLMLKADFFDAAYLQQNAFDPVDGATPRERQQFVFDKALEILHLHFEFKHKDQAREVMVRITSLFRNWNYLAWDPGVLLPDQAPESRGQDSEFKRLLEEIDGFIRTMGGAADEKREGGRFEHTGREIEGGGGPGEEEEDHRSGLHKCVKSVRGDGRPRSRKTLTGEYPDWEEEESGS